MKKEIKELVDSYSLIDLKTAIYIKEQQEYNDNDNNNIVAEKEEDKEYNFYNHELVCKIDNYMMDITLSKNINIKHLSLNEYVNDYENQINVDDDYYDGYGSFYVSLYTKSKTPTKEEITLLEKSLYDCLLNVQKTLKNFQNTLSYNTKLINKSFSFLRVEKLKKLI